MDYGLFTSWSVNVGYKHLYGRISNISTGVC